LLLKRRTEGFQVRCPSSIAKLQYLTVERDF
jgi:hypothetical protein